jgi:beta-1,4-mannosyl-glycoprotein beta-1,4-N-acetylglucosaminyltransferase
MERKRKIIDCFILFNEIDLLEKRLSYMDQYVDKFIISESPTTFSGKEKPFYFEENRERFSKWEDKIVYIKTKPLGEGFWDREKYIHLITDHSHGTNFEKWEREGQQRFAMEEELKNFDDEDIVIFSDVDEIPDMSKINFDTIGDELYVCIERLFRYSLDYMVKTTKFDSFSTVICSNKNAKEIGFIRLRDMKGDFKQIPEAGWHFSKFGGDEQALIVFENYSHSGEHDFEKHTREKTDFDTGEKLINTPQEIKDSIPKEFI